MQVSKRPILYLEKQEDLQISFLLFKLIVEFVKRALQCLRLGQDCISSSPSQLPVRV